MEVLGRLGLLNYGMALATQRASSKSMQHTFDGTTVLQLSRVDIASQHIYGVASSSTAAADILDTGNCWRCGHVSC